MASLTLAPPIQSLSHNTRSKLVPPSPTTSSFQFISNPKSMHSNNCKSHSSSSSTQRRTPIVRAAAAAAAATMGVEKEVLRAGNGPKPVPGQSVTVHCTGFGKNGDLGKKFWSTKDFGQKAFTFEVGSGQVIKGWDEGVLGMQLGEVARLRCSPDYAYGPDGFPAWGIQPNSVLVFEIEVLSLQ